MLFSGVLQNMYVAKFSSSSYINRFPVLFGRKLYVIDDEILEKVNANGSKRYSHFHAGQFSVDFAIGFDDGDKVAKEQFAKRAKETLPDGFPELHSNARYVEDSEIEKLFGSWFNDKLNGDGPESESSCATESEESLVIVVPGVGGGINEPQVRSLVYHLLQKGKNVAVINCRGCCRTPITTPCMTTDLDTDDLRYHVDSLHLKFPGKPLHLIGISFGGVLTTNYLAEEATAGNGDIITSAVSVFTFIMMNMIKNNKKVLCEHSEYCDEDEILKDYKTFKTGRQVDDKYVCEMAGFSSSTSFELAISPMFKTLKIETPMLILNTLDDPFTSSNYLYFDVQRTHICIWLHVT
ncbi:unnamed protein product [Ambrosiozyma monospora]|uniref:Unnamed protein product n=1 Tax=Ambrosiozyma monospora TaxID=43982 RepID=A0ACB5SR99_AMBMO|nr:unnamed protein product [Ambrosiozyma monospora]